MLRSILWDKHGQTQIPSSRRRTQVDPGVVDLHFNVNSNVRVLRQNVWTSAIPTPKKSNESDWSRRLWRSIKSMNSMEFIIVYLSPHAKPTSAVGNLPGSLPEWQYHHLPICNRHSTRLIRTVNLCNLGTCGLWSRTQLGAWVKSHRNGLQTAERWAERWGDSAWRKHQSKFGKLYNGGFLKLGYPKIIYFNKIFHCKPSSYWGTPMYGTPQMVLRNKNWETNETSHTEPAARRRTYNVRLLYNLLVGNTTWTERFSLPKDHPKVL